MGNKSSKNLWEFREAKGAKNLDRFIILMLSIAGFFCIVNLFEWWFQTEHIGNLFLFIILSLFFWYSIGRFLLIWISYFRLKKPEYVPPALGGLKVAVFTTSAPGEPLSMFEETFKAINNISYPHNTYLLDSTGDPAFKALAEQYGITWFDLRNLPGAKAGKINAALKRTTEDFILVLDPDHIVFPNFLDQTLGFFQVEEVGFVQVCQAYYNQYRSFTAAGAAEQTYTFYGPTQMGLFGYGCAVAIGANCTFRRKALESIGGHGEGLAEDLITSIRIHAAGWKSIYNPVIVSRGLVPEDFGSFCKQQLKWTRGVFEVLFVEFPKVYRKLTFWQKLSYFSIGTYYFVGLITLFFILIPFLYFATGVLPARMNFADFVIKGSYIVIIAAMIHFYVQKFLCHTKSERGFHWRGMILKYSCWPVFSLGCLLGILDFEIPYIPTEKKALIGFFSPFARPLILYCILFIAMVIVVYIHRRYFVPESELIFSAEKTWGMLGFSFIAFIMSLGGVGAASESLILKEENPWEFVKINSIIVPVNKKEKL